MPWFNVTPVEAEQVCATLGGHVCTLTDWQTACRVAAAGSSCFWGYDPHSACRSSFTSGAYCNLGVSFDFDSSTAGSQSGLLATGSARLQHCTADWSGLLGNPSGTGNYDITGNLREITKNAASDYRLMGGAFNTDTEAGATCDFAFYSVSQSFQLYDAGFRCCFTEDPTL
jgi:formylglycine-generating enzyme required for sulfatase activity